MGIASMGPRNGVSPVEIGIEEAGRAAHVNDSGKR
jgi:hypothetical protein